jgi:pentatricopeptide repeat protein
VEFKDNYDEWGIHLTHADGEILEYFGYPRVGVLIAGLAKAGNIDEAAQMLDRWGIKEMESRYPIYYRSDLDICGD